jgi:peptide/nickel transport system permease protein
MPVSPGYIIRRLVMTAIVVLGVLTIVFIATRVIPAHPEFLWAGPHATEEQLAEARRALHLDKPLVVQYYYFITSLLKGDLGVSWRTKNPVLEDIKTALPATLELAITGFLIGVSLGLPLGIISALRYGGVIDKLVRVISVSGSAIPVFWIALVFQLVSSIKLGILLGGYRVDPSLAIAYGFKPITGFYVIDTLIMGHIDLFLDVVRRLLMPALVVSIYPLCLTARMTRALALETLQEDFIRNLRSWGLPDNVIARRYLLKAVTPPLVASLGLSFGYTLIGAFIIEVVFSWNGLGMYAVLSLLSFDYPVVIGSIMVVAIFYTIINLIVDLTHAYVDPRVKL